ncbi:acyl-coenzyme A synthetase/AMP-(fatty) acid ligase [Roseovarius sp. MBR-78]|uniref:AMP-binding enzyme n=1 Tax=Roseovarius sp. MBR-78 TaxID=3156460 RepID=UPI003396A996
MGFLVMTDCAQREADALERKIVAPVRKQIGPVAAFRNALVFGRLPKTRSGKVLRGTMQKIADGESVRTPAAIEDPEVLDEIREALQQYDRAPLNGA